MAKNGKITRIGIGNKDRVDNQRQGIKTGIMEKDATNTNNFSKEIISINNQRDIE